PSTPESSSSGSAKKRMAAPTAGERTIASARGAASASAPRRGSAAKATTPAPSAATAATITATGAAERVEAATAAPLGLRRVLEVVRVAVRIFRRGRVDGVQHDPEHLRLHEAQP